MSRPTAQPETCRRDTPDVEAARAGWQRGGAMSRGVAHGEWLTGEWLTGEWLTGGGSSQACEGLALGVGVSAVRCVSAGLCCIFSASERGQHIACLMPVT